jgi:large subunit ribosomal protein L25
VAGERVRLEVREREKLGSRESRRLRRQGFIPGVLYGRGKKAHAFVVSERDLRAALSGSHGLHAILDVALDGQTTAHASVLKEYQQDPLRGYITHIDLHEVPLDKPIHVQVAVELVGDSPGLKEGGVLSQLVREVNVEALPLEVPDSLRLDITGTEIGATLRVADLQVPGGAQVLDDPENVLVTISAPRLAAELEALEAELAAEAEEAEEAEEVEEGVEAPEAAAGDGEAATAPEAEAAETAEE